MPDLWCGGEDLDFQNGDPPGVNTFFGQYRTAYARCGIQTFNSIPYFIRGTTWAAATSFWAHCQIYRQGTGLIQQLLFGLMKSGTSSGLFVGANPASVGNPNQLALFKWDGAAMTLLATETGSTFPGGVLLQLDIQVINFGAAATVNVYVNSVRLISFTGNVAAPGLVNLDQVAIAQTNSNSQVTISEVIVSTDDTRTFSLSTLPPTGPGRTDAWAGSFTDVNEIVMNDATSVSTNTAGLDEQFVVGTLPPGSLFTRSIMVSARASNTVGAVVTTVALGVNSGGTVDPGAPQALTTAWSNANRLMSVNPVTSAPWGTLPQVNLRSGS